MPRVRVYEIAKSLGVETSVVLKALQDLGEFVRSASSPVESPVERRLREEFRRQGVTAPATAVPAQPRLRDDGLTGLGAAFFGLSPDDPRLARLRQADELAAGQPDPFTVERPLRPPPSAQPGRRLSREAVNARARANRAAAYEREQARSLAWAKRLFTPAERLAWTSAGLGENDAAMAEQCKAQGLTPGDLATKVYGRTVASRLHGGESVTSIAVMLHEIREGTG